MIKKILLFLIVILGFCLRLYKINIPIADHHSWRQADSAAVIKNLSVDFNIFHPRWNNFSVSNAKNLPNPNRYFFEDFPLAFDIYPAILIRLFGENILFFRLPSIMFSLLTIVFLYLLVGGLTNTGIGLVAAFIYAVLPFSIYFSRGVFQEIPLNFYSIAALYYLYLFLKQEEGKKHKLFFFLATVFNILLFLTKPYALMFLLPETFLFYSFFKSGFIKRKSFWMFFIFSLLPFLFWWIWVNRFPEGIPGSAWLLNEGNIRFKGAFFYWIFNQRIGALILGIWGVVFFGSGVLLFERLNDKLFYFWFISLLVYVTIIAKGNVTHDYYQIPFLPVIAYFCAKGIDFLWTQGETVIGKSFTLVVMTIIFVLSLAFSWYEVRGFYNLKSGVDLAGDFINKNTPKDSLVIAGDGADPTLLFNTNRLGWTIGYGSGQDNNPAVIDQLKSLGADYYLTTAVNQIKNSSFEQYLKNNYLLLKETDQYIIFSLSK